jgi:membrane-bound serine protease (ClpP class)
MRRHRLKRARWLSGAILSLGVAAMAMLATPHAFASQERPVVYVIPIEGTVDMGLAPFVQRILAEASRENAAAVIVEINTFGGRVDAAVVIRDALLSSPMKTVAFINRRAISAGALITLAAEQVAMTDGGTVGAATPVMAGGGEEAQPVEEKSVSYVRSEFRSTAETRNRPANIAEAMVDEDVSIPGLIEAGKLLTMTTEEALEHGIADFRANSVAELLAQLDLAGAELRTTEPNWAEGLVRLITSPLVASLLISLAMIGILLEIRTPGFGVPGAVGMAALVVVLGGHWVVELVGWEHVLLIAVGLTLIGLEVFVIPGFGIAGVLGIAAVLAAMAMGLAGSGATARTMALAAGRVSFSMILALAATVVLMRFLPRFPFGRRLILDTGLPPGGGDDVPVPVPFSHWLGRTGRTTTPLRPAGIADIDGERVDVVSSGEMIETGAAIVVSRVDGNRIVVRRHLESSQGNAP